ncbi:radical SAM domain protein [Limnospira platensis NIES-39]|jgi:wyosine [tRNA(Phe)-imidazoG37] synthetase (radical SAM superfamily)|uniref:Radical SAM domain protein n=2 Tax=Oscillatoriophycideae TaxID=1301283 RepID=A0A5M3TDA2_LIMPL|nr:radical SAM domain protein [Arthrospira platensis NIES-39]BDT16599.1 radical SAM domain protein [Arthrospira platensis NIES-39]GCE95479.1 radical SAM domain protein [Arthrospira platensis NIES-46]
MMMSDSTIALNPFTPVYGPVSSWRYGRSLGIDPIGVVSTCSFNCVYCQLGEIEQKTSDRQVYVPTAEILTSLENFAPRSVDVITLSGSGEPTLAANLGEILTGIKRLSDRPTLVLTNGTTLNDPQVRSDLAIADKVSIKLDGVSSDQLRRVNRPVPGIDFNEIMAGLLEFRQDYQGEIGIQTMLLCPWDESTRREYISLMAAVAPREIQLNTPKRPKPVQRQFDGRENHTSRANRPYQVRSLRCVDPEILHEFAQEIQQKTGIMVRTAPIPATV